MTDTTICDTPDVKGACRRMREHLGNNGIKVPHSLLLEAMAKAFDLKNWRTLKALLEQGGTAKAAAASQPENASKHSSEAPSQEATDDDNDGGWLSWKVEAVYIDNLQGYGDEFGGRTAREAVTRAQLSRWMDFCNEISILNVYDDKGRWHLSSDYTEQHLLGCNKEMLQRLAAELNRLLKDSEHAGRCPGGATAVRWLSLCAEDISESGAKDLCYYGLLDDCEKQHRKKGKPNPKFAVGAPSKTLEALCDWVLEVHGGAPALEEKGPSSMGLAEAIYQLYAICEELQPLLDDPEFSLLAEYALAAEGGGLLGDELSKSEYALRTTND